MVTRVHYREGQILRIADLRDEQAYRIQMRRRHNLAHHGWGIVQGLELLGSVAEGVKLSPGMAIDGFGRELFVSQPVVLSSDIFNHVGPERLHELDLWLLYRLNALMPQDFARCREEPVLWLTPAADIDPRCPIGVLEADLAFGPHLDAPDDPARCWPVYLGRLRDWRALDSVDILDAPGSHLIDHSRRPYVGLVGQLVTAPSGSAQMQVGSEAASRRERYAVRLPGENQTWNDWLTLDRKGNLALKGDTAIEGELAVARDIHFDPLKEPPAIPAPWQVYYTIPVIQQPAVDAGAPAPAPIKQHQLRFEILHPGDQGDPSSQQFVIGKSEQAGSNHQFQPCLTVDADGTVKMKGNVLVEGQVVESPIKPDVSDPRFGAALLQSWVQGQGAAATQSDVFQATKLLVEILLDPTTFPTIPEYKVELTNTGNINITNIQIFEVLTSASKSYEISAIGSPGFTLGAGSPQRAEDVSNIVTRHKLQLGQDTKFTLTVTAIGAGPGFFTQATDSKQVTIGKTS